MTSFLRAARRRWGLFGSWLVAAVLPAGSLTLMFASADRWGLVLPSLWADFIAGPVHYWAPLLLGHPTEFDIHPMAGTSTWVYAMCLPLAFAHPVSPRSATAVVTSAAFIAWYGWAWLTFVAFNAPC